jgi:predicted enzyme related to lactoylglutathione lyase
MNNYPRAFSHIGISVPDVAKAVEFYSEVMGWYVIMKPSVITEESDTPIGLIFEIYSNSYELTYSQGAY